MARIDERDIMFSRMCREKGSKEYNDYYQARPEKKEIDDRIRAMPAMTDKQTKFFNVFDSPIIDATFEFLSDISGLVDGGIQAEEKLETGPDKFTEKLEGLARFYGAKLSGVAELKRDYYYSYRGRTDAVYGEKVDPDLPYTFVFAVEMDPSYVNSAPTLTESIGVTKAYLDAAIVGMILAYYIRLLGYRARNHMDGNYLMVLPLAGKEAGLGDIGRHGLLVTPEYGTRVRLGAVSTDMPLVKSEPSPLKIEEFCNRCRRCAQVCPSQSISKKPAEIIDGVRRWQTHQESCYSKWRELGTDCGFCVAVCPFSLPMEKEDIAAYYKDPKQAHELLKKYKTMAYREKIDDKKLDWLEEITL
ncbi:MAG: 4Fe-4S dicluster domain-containing protein [Fastidiosipila sp.]|nr:4Fe-4S dicluster domain-containing protein [Fastidiosipila sp.]